MFFASTKVCDEASAEKGGDEASAQRHQACDEKRGGRNIGTTAVSINKMIGNYCLRTSDSREEIVESR